ncbi:MAG: hypothetical protein IJT94_04610, partial [Oscillibacter sp.]|nr:hypothetical protein [Oscillibacter sp.]
TFQNNYGADTILTSLLNRVIGQQFGTRAVPQARGGGTVSHTDTIERELERLTERRENTAKEANATDRLFSSVERIFHAVGQSPETAGTRFSYARTQNLPGFVPVRENSTEKLEERFRESAERSSHTDSVEREMERLTELAPEAVPQFFPAGSSLTQNADTFNRADTHTYYAGDSVQYAPSNRASYLRNSRSRSVFQSAAGDNSVLYDMSGDTLNTRGDTYTLTQAANDSYAPVFQTNLSAAEGAAAGTTAITNAPVTAEYLSQSFGQNEYYPFGPEKTLPAMTEEAIPTPPMYTAQDSESLTREIRESRILDISDSGDRDTGAGMEDRQGAQAGPAAQSGAQGGEKVIRHILELVGKGSIDIGRSSREEVVTVMQAYLKPVLMGMLRQEMYEEGDGGHGDF